MKSATALLAVLIAASTAATAYANPRSVDVHTFDIAGVKLGMNYDQAVAALAQHFHVPQTLIEPEGETTLSIFATKHPDYLIETGLLGKNIVTQTELPQFITYKNGNVEVTVYFEARVPVDRAHPLAVDMVRYEIPWTGENVAAMKKAALSKYGAPTDISGASEMEWCESTKPGRCLIDNKAKLELNDNKIILNDPVWHEAVSKFMDAASAGKTNF